MVIPVFNVEELLQTNSCQGSQFTLKVLITYIYTQTYHERRLINYQLSINLGENLCRLNMFLQLALHVRYLCETQGNVTNSRNIGKDISEHLDKKKKNHQGGKVIYTVSSFLISTSYIYMFACFFCYIHCNIDQKNAQITLLHTL